MLSAVVTVSNDYTLGFLILGNGWEAGDTYLFIVMQLCCCLVCFHKVYMFTLTFKGSVNKNPVWKAQKLFRCVLIDEICNTVQFYSLLCN